MANRNGVLDFWRGFVLLTIFANHIPGNLVEHFTHRNFGFSDGAEAFVFIAGVAVALAYFPSVPGGDLAGVVTRCLKRALHLYRVHLTLTFSAVGLFAIVYVLTDMADLLEHHGRGSVFNDTARGITGVLLLGHQLGYFNILPLYVVLLLWTPVVFALVRIHPGLAVATSALLYAAARLWGVNLPSWPEPGAWYFNPFAWQLLYTLGILAGIAFAGSRVPYSPTAFRLSLGVLALSLVGATQVFGQVPGFGDWLREAVDLDKSNLGLVRLVHFLALAYVVSQLPLGAALAQTWAGQELQRLGRQALAIFAVGSFLSALGQVIMTLSEVRYSASPTLIGMVFTLAGAIFLLLLARYLEWGRADLRLGRGPLAAPRSSSLPSPS